ncbi:hypothetical protein AWM70_02790 [Paenibacillus yonginensis]|uniref:Uncharacterized protein n=1 Tax=Paenibacillus yonginensis TaxID=1462996 RepID=A0A1B1MWU8_9BACL|nr:hypothetical protein [Paenibacillus yonginensis]ANS73635.1 hypothetical protein AWM70_02790 [Paenibacillus yonginensis]
METTICPWCQTEIVWDEEIGPEEECPHCHNELKGYRTLNVTLSDNEEELDKELEQESYSSEGSWMEEEESSPRNQGLTSLPSLGGQDTDLLAYESAIGKILETQDQMPECPHCRGYMIFTGQNSVGVGGYQPVIPAGLKHSLLEAPIRMNVYVCPSCFHVSSFLTDEDRIRFAGQVQKAGQINED